MKRGVSRARWMLLAASVALAAGAWAARREFPPGHFPAKTELASLQVEAEMLRGADDPAREKWRQSVRDLRRSAWTAADLTALERRLGPEWRRSAELPGRDVGVRRMEFSRTAVPLGAWPEFVRQITELEARPGLRVVALDLAIGGVGAQRRFTRMAFAVQVIWAAGDGNAERSASLGPLPVSPPVPAAPRERTGRSLPFAARAPLRSEASRPSAPEAALSHQP